MILRKFLSDCQCVFAIAYRFYHKMTSLETFKLPLKRLLYIKFRCVFTKFDSLIQCIHFLFSIAQSSSIFASAAAQFEGNY